VRLEDVRFARSFSCPECGKQIRVASHYERGIQLAGWPLGLLILYLLGVRGWVILVLCWVPLAMVLMGLWMYIGIYFLPPRLERDVLEPPSVLGLGSR
jgi:hypothetical protein